MGQPPGEKFIIQLAEDRAECKKKDKADQDIDEFDVGDLVKINLHSGRIVDGKVKAVLVAVTSLVCKLRSGARLL
jgi:hypothetical protein